MSMEISAKFAIIVALLHRGYLLFEVVLIEFACLVILGSFERFLNKIAYLYPFS